MAGHRAAILFNQDLLYECSLYTINNHVKRLIFTTELPDKEQFSNGFIVYNFFNNEIQGDFSDYKTVYRTYESNPLVIELSNNNTIYIPIDDSKEYIEIEPTLSQVKDAKISELQLTCKKNIEAGVDVEIEGQLEHFNYSLVDGDQEDIESLFTAAVTTKMGQSYHCHNGNCKIYTVEQIVAIYVAQKKNTMHHKTYFNQIKQYVNSFNTDDDINTILSIFYGYELTGEYLETYNYNMMHAQKVIDTTLEGYGLVLN